MKRIVLLLLILSLLLAVALPAAAAGGPSGRRPIQRRTQRLRRVRNHRMFIEDPAQPLQRATPAVQRIQPPVIKQHPHGPDWRSLSQRLSELSKRFPHLSPTFPNR